MSSPRRGPSRWGGAKKTIVGRTTRESYGLNGRAPVKKCWGTHARAERVAKAPSNSIERERAGAAPESACISLKGSRVGETRKGKRSWKGARPTRRQKQLALRVTKGSTNDHVDDERNP